MTSIAADKEWLEKVLKANRLVFRNLVSGTRIVNKYYQLFNLM